MPDLCCHNLNNDVIFNWFVLTASILCNFYCPFLLFVLKKSSHFMFLHVNWNVCFLTTRPNK